MLKIRKEDLLTGIFRTLEKVDDSIESAERLHDLHYYIPSSALSTISYEESIKGIILCSKLLGREDVSENEWEDMKDHQFKLKHYQKKSFEKMASGITSEEFDRFLKRYTMEWGLEPRASNKEQFVNEVKSDLEVLPKYQVLRERCLYSDWNKSTNNWYNLKAYSVLDLKSLSTYMMSMSANEQRNFCFNIELTVNHLRSTGIKIDDLPYPNYNEVRTKIRDFDSIKEMGNIQNKIIQNRKQLKRGFRIFKKIVSN